MHGWFSCDSPLTLWVFPEASVLCDQCAYLDKVFNSCAVRGNGTRLHWAWKREFSKGCRIKNKNIFMIISVLKEQAFRDIWEFNVLFLFEFFSCATTELGQR